MESLHLQMLKDGIHEKEQVMVDPDHWYELNLTNAYLFPNIPNEKIKQLEQLVPGRLFTTRIPINLNQPDQIMLRENNHANAKKFMEKINNNNLKVIFCVTESNEFHELSKLEYLIQFYKQDCGQTVINSVIEESDIPIKGDFLDSILNICHHLAKGRNCLVHCTDGNGKTGMVVASILQNFGVKDVFSRIRRVNSKYVNSLEQEKYLNSFVSNLDSTLINNIPHLAYTVAAEQLVPLYRKHKLQLGKETSKIKEEQCSDIEFSDKPEVGDEKEWKEGYTQIFGVLDNRNSGKLCKGELFKLFELLDTEIYTSELKAALEGKDEDFAEDFTTEKFVDFMKKTIYKHDISK